MYAMEQQPPSQQQQHQGYQGHRDILSTPVWLLAIRIAQAVLSVVILGLAASVVHDAYLDELGLAIAISLITVLIVTYFVVTEKVAACQPAYHIVAVLALDAFLLVLWLATFAAVAARRARFVFDVAVDGCSNNGDLFNSKTCFVKRAVILFKRGADTMSAAAGIGALVWILFIVTFVWTLVHFLKGRKQGRFPLSTGSTATAETNQMDPKVEQQQQYQTPIQQPQVHGQYQQPTPTQSPPPQPAQSPYQQQPPFSPPPAGTYPPTQGQQQQQHPYRQYPQYSQPQPQAYQQPVQPVQPVGSELPAQQPPQTYQHQ
ncbi:membrane-associating domain-containing protein [Hirsutella rhossiliensis]|uniref:Membrane-associating domain-containing protein n=1 Tax=Hirsutella rhossiliensis TaxID=111463 RepID=A0A9P8MN05_9HYPO|nr:membrane-associating domain-containing protein [Hirsutella rhossiliensis]KAH0959203.1 membrane-associating domain-containing protein [Hirsutella rhossiliensis]